MAERFRHELQVTAERPAEPGRSGEKVTTTIDAHYTGAMLSDFGRKVLSQLRAAVVPLPATAPQLLGILKEKNAQVTSS